MMKSLMFGVLVAAVLLMGAVTAKADTSTTAGTITAGRLGASGDVAVHAAVNSALLLSVATLTASQSVNFGAVDPGGSYGPQPSTLQVWSNKTYNISVAKIGDAEIGLSTTLPNSSNNARTNPSATYVDNYSLNVPWGASPGAYSANVQYTVVQN